MKVLLLSVLLPLMCLARAAAADDCAYRLREVVSARRYVLMFTRREDVPLQSVLTVLRQRDLVQVNSYTRLSVHAGVYSVELGVKGSADGYSLFEERMRQIEVGFQLLDLSQPD